MKKMSYILVLVGFLTLTACSSNSPTASSSVESNESTSSTEVAEMKVTVSLMKDGKEVTNKELTLKEGTTLMDAMKENFDLVEENKMITAIDGIEQDKKESYYWTYKINDEMVNTGAAETTLHPNDKVVFTYDKF